VGEIGLDGHLLGCKQDWVLLQRWHWQGVGSDEASLSPLSWKLQGL